MANDLISRKALQTSIRREDGIVVGGLQYIRADAVSAKISMAPTVILVKCKDCALRRTYECPMKSSGSGSYIGHGMYDEGSDRTHDNGYCHKGTKR